MKPVWKLPGSMLLKLRYDGALSNVAFNLILRRYSKDPEWDMMFVPFALVGRCRLPV
jgi:hypothetical protein